MTRAFGAFAVLLVLSGPLVGSEPSAQTQRSLPRQDYEATDIAALDALVRLGEIYDHPMGIICRDAKILSTKISVKITQATAQQALKELMVRLPEYKWSEDNGVFEVRPRLLPTQTEKILNIRIPRIVAENIDVDALSNRLWMELQIQMDPGNRSKGFIGHGHLRDYYELGRVDFTNAGVDQVLNEIARRRKSAAWILLPPPDVLSGALRERLWGIVTYASPPRPLDQLCCLRLDYLQ